MKIQKWSDTLTVEVHDSNIIHLIFNTQKELALTMGRPQEYYESDIPELYRRVFTYEDFVSAYTSDTGHFEYLHSWRGYNIPGHILEEFFDHFLLTPREVQLLHVVREHRDRPYYVIASSRMHPDVLDHELVHAHYYLNSEYHEQAEHLVEHMDPEVKQQLVDKFTEWGYNPSVFVDEINAYMSTSSEQYVTEKMKLSISEQQMQPFIQLANTVLTEEQHCK